MKTFSRTLSRVCSTTTQPLSEAPTPTITLGHRLYPKDNGGLESPETEWSLNSFEFGLDKSLHIVSFGFFFHLHNKSLTG